MENLSLMVNFHTKQSAADEWGSVSKDAKNLINRMLHVNPNYRISAKQALNDAWIVKHC